MEIPAKYDFYMKFKPIYKENKFIDFILIYISDSFGKITEINPSHILGKRLSHIAAETDKFKFKELCLSMIPNSNIKYELYVEELRRWYIVNTFSDGDKDENLTIAYYVDVTDIKQKDESIVNFKMEENKIIYLKDKEKLLYRDKLTGLYNKSFFEEELLRLDTKRQLPISIIMGDINGLKLINDAFGHTMGDNTLKKAAEIMTNSFREEDIISRVGGDEFVILLPKTSEKTSLEIIDRIKKMCENNPLEFIKISISFGVATKLSEEEDLEKIYKKAENKMYFNKLKESKAAKLAMINFLKKRLEKITYETKSHYGRLHTLTIMMADALNLSEKQKDELKLLCEFHDIGKIGVSKSILQKEGSLNEEEWESVKRHSEIGYHVVKEIKKVSAIDELILIHHERWDGKGYPGILKDEEIPLTARIFAIADAYDSMVNDRPFKGKITKKAALNEIMEQSGRQFDPKLTKLFVNLMDEEQIG
ncbi:MAG TPA: diguanylate cyclase [Sedimentibacter sp.]|nr:diguanylate cyclase [Sedimentibacter sp.]HQC70237.1 diguanylate cyclase [Sedimentibacter sp.]